MIILFVQTNDQLASCILDIFFIGYLGFDMLLVELRQAIHAQCTSLRSWSVLGSYFSLFLHCAQMIITNMLNFRIISRLSWNTPVTPLLLSLVHAIVASRLTRTAQMDDNAVDATEPFRHKPSQLSYFHQCGILTH
ncbi:uncharacterized protein F5147DRAFT_724445 [Suillus discolor]|uniref:Uncharacterized protein n=1 Tax=Suillus discolor TaxID=1912936 RepID=A0A9P7ETU7_9AGAM|nr:uncharacterized protein F5147DRAFT_724445 [Suillus discolor]KAG2090754.1 hypothetical protein F5147DRAFT_724445 [Suillus discolor]